MDVAAWLAEFARQQDQRERVWREERQVLWDRIGREPNSNIGASERPSGAVVLVPGRTLEPDEIEVSAPSAARKVGVSALAYGWSVRTVASMAADPGRGIVEVVTVRCRRHDERLWAAWRDGHFDAAWYVGATGLERVGSSRLSTLARSAATRAAKAGVEVKAPTMRGVLDVIEGVRGPKQWVDLLERQEMDRAIQVLRDASLGPAL